MNLGLPLGQGAPSVFTPTSIAGLQLWLKADSLSLNDGDPVSAWNDSTANANNAAGAGTNRPLYKANVFNGLPMVRFDGVNDYMTIARNAGLEPNNITTFVIMRGGSIPFAFSYALSKKYSSGAVSSYAQGIGNVGWRGLCRVATSGSVGSGTQVAAAVAFNGNPHVMTVKNDASNLYLYIDGYQFSKDSAVGNLTYDANDLLLGAYDPTQLYMAVDIGEVLIYNTALSDLNRQKAQGYLSQRWAIP